MDHLKMPNYLFTMNVNTHIYRCGIVNYKLSRNPPFFFKNENKI